MAVPAGPTEVRYVGNGVSTVFTIPFLLILPTDLDVFINGVEQASGYLITGAGNPTSTITFTTAPALGADVYLALNVPFERLNDYQENGDFLSSTVNRDFDRIWQALKQLFRGATRALTLGSTDVDGSGWYRAKGNGIRGMADPVAEQDAVNFRSMRTMIEQALAGVVGGLGWFLQIGVGAIQRTFQDKMRDVVSVKDFGAKGDGITDDSDAVQAAFLSTNKAIFFPAGTYRITRTLYRVEGLILGEGFQSKLLFDNLNGADGIVFAPVSYQSTSGAESLAMLARGSNGGRAFSTPYNAQQYNVLYTNWRWENLKFSGATTPAPGTNNAFETIETWLCSIEQGDGFSCTITGIWVRGNYRSDTDPSIQAQSCFLRMTAASALLTTHVGKLTVSNVYRGVEIGDRCFFVIDGFDIAHAFDGIYQTGLPGNVYGESRLNNGNINAQHFGIFFDSAPTRQIGNVVIRRHKFGWKGATYSWAGIRVVNSSYVFMSNIQIAPDESGGAFTGTHYGVQLVDCGGVNIEGAAINPGLDRGFLLDNSTMTTINGVESFQNEATDLIFRAINNARSSRIGSYTKVSTFIGQDYSDDGSIVAGAIQQNQRNVIPEGSTPHYIWRRISSALNEKIWKAASGATTWALQMTTDDEATNTNAIILTRSGTTMTSMDIRTSRIIVANGPTLNAGGGSPEGSVTASQGSTYMRTSGGASTSFYVKESGTGNTGWVAK